MELVIIQMMILAGVWINVTLGLIALYDRRKKNNVHRRNAESRSFLGLP